jgi:hypothetical protein
MAVRGYAKTLVFIVLLIALALVPKKSSATAIAFADVSLAITIIDIVGGDTADLIITIEAFVSDFDAFSFGNASALADGDATSNVDGLMQLSIADSLADPIGIAAAFHLTDGIIILENVSPTDTFEVMFSIEYTAMAEATVDNPVNEDAFALADVFVRSDLLGDIVDVFVLAEAFSGIADPPVSDAIDFPLFLGPGETDFIGSFVESEALAFSIPEPSTMLLIATGLVGLAGFRRNFRK